MLRGAIALWNGSEALTMIEVIGIRRLGDFKLELEFSDGTVGAPDFELLLRRTGPIIPPLQQRGYFGRVLVEDGALAGANGYDWVPIAVHDEMKAAGLLRQSRAGE